MSIIKTRLKERTDLYSIEIASKAQIKTAEKQLGLTFAKDYYDVLSEYGAISVNGHEITGISKSERLDVVRITISERQKNISVAKNMYVIEKANIDDIIIWQSSDGSIYKTFWDSQQIKICSSLVEYMDL